MRKNNFHREQFFIEKDQKFWKKEILKLVER